MVRSTAQAHLKQICSEQISKLQVRHQHDLELLDDIRSFSKQRAAIEANYSSALLKLTQQHLHKRDSNSQQSDSTDKPVSKSPQKVWRSFVEEMEKTAKCHHQMSEVYMQQIAEPAKILRHSKAQVLKKVVDQLSSVQKEALQSSNELGECHKVYLKEEQAAADARKKADELDDKVKKKSTGLFQSMAALQKKSEKSSQLRDQCDIKSTAARNAYIIQLTLVNAQLSKYFESDLPSLIRQLDSNVTGQIQQFMAVICREELESCSAAVRGLSTVQGDVEHLSGQKTMQNFFQDFPVFKEAVQYPFDPVEGDSVDHVSTKHGGDEMITAETKKWANFLVQESKNINSLKGELVNIRRTLMNASRLASPGEGPGNDPLKTVINIVEESEARLDDLRMAIRRSRTSKFKAEAVLDVFRNVGIDVSNLTEACAEAEDEDEDEESICADIRQLQHQLRVGAAQPALLALSPNLSAGRASALSVATGGSSTNISQASSALASPKEKTAHQQKSERMASAPVASTATTAMTSVSAVESQPLSTITQSEFAAQSSQFSVDDRTSSVGQSFDYAGHYDEEEERIQNELQNDTAVPPEKWSSGLSFPMYGVSLYDYQAGNYDELSVFAGDHLEVVGDGDSEGWLMARTQVGQTGFIPEAYIASFQTEGELQVYAANMERENREAAAAEAEAAQPEGYPPPEQPSVASVPSFELTQPSPTTELADTEIKNISSSPSNAVQNGGTAENGVAMPVSGDMFAQALYDFDGVDDDEISFLEGDMICVLARDYNGVDDGYWYGELNGGRRGWFPSMVVEVLDSPSGEVALPGELKSPESGPPGFIPPPPVVLIEATPVPTPHDSPTGTHSCKRGQRNSQSSQQDEDTDSGFGGTSMNQGAATGETGQDDENVQQQQQQQPAQHEEEDEQPTTEQAETDSDNKPLDVMSMLRSRAVEITEIVLNEAKEAMAKGELVVMESFEEVSTALTEAKVETEAEVENAAAVVTTAIASAANIVSANAEIGEEEKAEVEDSAEAKGRPHIVSISSEGAVSFGEEEGHHFIDQVTEEAIEKSNSEDEELSLR